MNYRKIYYSIRALSVLSFFAIAYEYWGAGLISLAILLAPYATLFFLANENKYSNLKLTIARAVSAVVTFLLVPFMLFGIEVRCTSRN
ncbi:hypothetical protein [Thalassotalea euphylliae]|uniref:Uncharacterized protein n=1 Tax=Thalassotalea euphylliae TaxID=1655234 RepID=A0A3E0TZ20_9GAMM|nr:hypothetical protein [Thalassotalea euphylliae]REL29647.1 hypothetical protein DXX94_02350 [Thalassotalea euphylliae]